MSVLILLAGETHIACLLPSSYLYSVQGLPNNQHPPRCCRMSENKSNAFMYVPINVCLQLYKEGSSVKKAIHVFSACEPTLKISVNQKLPDAIFGILGLGSSLLFAIFGANMCL